MPINATSRKGTATALKFPAGLRQPPGSLRFGMDALLLAAFICEILNGEEREARRLVELGCGCGAALLGVALAEEKITGLGVDKAPELVDAATENARNLGVADRIEMKVADVRQTGTGALTHGGEYELALANPPWLETRSGKSSPSSLRENAIVGGKGILAAFCQCASYLLREAGSLCMILPMGLFTTFQNVCKLTDFGLIRIKPLQAFEYSQPSRFLALAKKHVRAHASLEHPLILHANSNGMPEINADALAFCPWLKNR